MSINLKPCSCGGNIVLLHMAVRKKNNKTVYCYQCEYCKKSGYAFAESIELAQEIWNDTVSLRDPLEKKLKI